MSHPPLFAVPLAALVLSLASQATADMAPPEGYVEECTLANRGTESSECVECQETRNPSGGAKGRCTTLLSGYCYKSVCDAWGGTLYKQIWCRAKDARAPALPSSISSQLSGNTAPTVEANALTPDAAQCSSMAPVDAADASTATAKHAPLGAGGSATGGSATGGSATGGAGGTPISNATGGASQAAGGGRESAIAPRRTGGASNTAGGSTGEAGATLATGGTAHAATTKEPEKSSGCNVSRTPVGEAPSWAGLLGLALLALAIGRAPHDAKPSQRST